MKTIYKIVLAAGLSTACFTGAFAQTTPAEEEIAQSEKSTVQQAQEPDLVKSKSTIQDKRREKQLDEIREINRAKASREAEFKKPDPYNTNSESFTVTKFRESKTKKKLRRGEGRVRMSVPDPKGKPLKHKKKSKFRIFGN